MHFPYRLSLLALSLSGTVLACSTPTESIQASGDEPNSDGPAAESDPGDPSASTSGISTSTGSPTPSDTTETSNGTGSSSGAGSSESTAGGGAPIVFDFGGIPDAPPFDEKCGQVDFLFVIDNSGSMGDEQANLVANFPAFINGIQTVLETVDSYQVGVVTTDAYGGNAPGCNELSSLVVQTNGFDSSNMVCGPFADGYNFMTEADDLESSFSCAAQVGTSGNAIERPMQAVVEAAQRIQGGPGQCNENFIRDDALLVIVIITDEVDAGSTGDAMSWYQDVLEAKLDIPENVVTVSIINTMGGGCFGDVANNIAAFTDMWGDNGFQVPICAPDYAPFFDQAISIIDVACDNFVPPD